MKTLTMKTLTKSLLKVRLFLLNMTTPYVAKVFFNVIGVAVDH